MLPAVAQGGDRPRAAQPTTTKYARTAARAARRCGLDPYAWPPSGPCLEVLDGSCRTPIAALAELGGGGLSLRAQIIRPDGSEALEAARRGKPTEAAALGTDAGEDLRGRAGPGFFDAD